MKHGNIDSISRLSIQSDNIENVSVLENQVLITDLCNSPITSNVVAKHSPRDPKKVDHRKVKNNSNLITDEIVNYI